MPWIILLTLAFGIGRFFVPVLGRISNDDFFKDAAHLFVGGLFGTAIYATRRIGIVLQISFWKAFKAEWKWWALAIGLTILEVVAFLVRRS